MLVTVEGIVTDFSVVHCWNVPYGMLVTPGLISAVRSELQYPNAEESKLVTVDGTVTDPSA